MKSSISVWRQRRAQVQDLMIRDFKEARPCGCGVTDHRALALVLKDPKEQPTFNPDRWFYGGHGAGDEYMLDSVLNRFFTVSCYNCQAIKKDGTND